MASRKPNLNTDNNTREAGHSSRYHPPVTPSATTSAPGSHGDRTTYTGFSPPRQTDGAYSLQAILGIDTSLGPAVQQRQGRGQFPTPGWGRGHYLQIPGSVPEPSIIPNSDTNGADPFSLRGFGQESPAESRTPTPDNMSVVARVSSSTLSLPSQYLLDDHTNGSVSGSSDAAFFRTYQDSDNSTILTQPVHHTSPSWSARALTIFANSQRLKERDGRLSALNAAIEALNLAWEASGSKPAKHVYNHVGITLKMIKVCFLFCNDELLVYLQPG